MRSTPNRLRGWTAAILVLMAALLTALSVTVADTQQGIHRVGREAAPLAQATSDLYFTLSDLDAQTARKILVIGDDALSGVLLDAERTFDQRLSDIDNDLRQAIAGTSDVSAQATLQTMLDNVARYHSLAGQAVTLDQVSADTAPGKPAATALSYFSQATDLLHFKLLPAAAQLRDTYAAELTTATNSQRDTARRDLIVSVVVAVVLVLVLLRFQRKLTRRFARALNPLLATATLVAVGVLGAVAAMNLQQTSRLHNAVVQRMAPCLAIQHARAVTFDATGAAIRYVVAPNFGYERGLKADADSLVTVDGHGLLASALVGTDPTLAQTIEHDWPAVLKDGQTAMIATDNHDVDSALAIATGIARGQTAFDFYVLDLHLGRAAATQRDGFEADMATTRSGASGWAGVPAVALGGAMVLVMAGIRTRLAEYR